MPAPTFIASYGTTYAATGTSQSITVTSQPGDTLIVYGGGDTNGATALTLSGLAGNGVTFTLQQSVALNSHSSAFIWSGIDATGGTNWTLSCNASNGTPQWGFTCVVFRNAAGSGASNKTDANGAPSLGLTTTRANSAIVVFNNDWGSLDGSSRVWRTVNSITPSAGNGLELTYVLDSGTITLYGAYYNDVGAPGAVTLGLSAPTGQTYSIVAAEVFGIPSPSVATVAWLHV